MTGCFIFDLPLHCAIAQILNPIVVITRLGRAIQYSRCFDICTA